MMEKIKLIPILVVIGLLFPLTATYFGYIAINNEDLAFNCSLPYDNDFLRVSDISEKIHINNNWSVTKNAGLCTGNGTFSDPYIIENFEITTDDFGTCILIENSNVYFKIKNCHLDAGNAHLNAAILLNNVSKAEILINVCQDSYMGIYLSHCTNFTISENSVTRNQYGIDLSTCDNINISENTVYNNIQYGISLFECFYTTITRNIVNANLYHGIHLCCSDYNTITGNTIDSNTFYGINLHFSDYNTITGNTITRNEECIHEEKSIGNTFSNNGDCTYGQVPIELIIIIMVIIIGSAIGITIFLLRRVDRKRSESQI